MSPGALQEGGEKARRKEDGYVVQLFPHICVYVLMSVCAYAPYVHQCWRSWTGGHTRWTHTNDRFHPLASCNHNSAVLLLVHIEKSHFSIDNIVYEQKMLCTVRLTKFNLWKTCSWNYMGPNCCCEALISTILTFTFCWYRPEHENRCSAFDCRWETPAVTLQAGMQPEVRHAKQDLFVSK